MRPWLAAGCALALTPGIALAADPVWRFTGGVEYSTGNYGFPVPTDVVAVPLTAKFTDGPWSFRASVPILWIDGPANVDIIDQTGGGDISAPPGLRTARAGLGDTTFSTTYSFSRIGRTPAYLDLSGRVRVPTGDQNKGFGVGAVDWMTDAELGWDASYGGGYVMVGRRFLGDAPTYRRVDGWRASTGAWIIRGPYEFGASYSWRQPSVPGDSDAKEIGAYLSRRLGRSWKGQIYGGAGLTDASPDLRVGVALTWRGRLGRR